MTRAELTASGEVAGLREGKQLGVSRGFEIGMEVGFITGSVQSWQAVQRQHPGTFSERVEKGIAAISEMLETFPHHPQDDRLQECMADLRGKFKAVVVIMGLKNEYFPDRPGDRPTTAF